MTKKIEAIIREEKLHDVKEALRAIGIVGMNVSRVRGHGRSGGITLAGRAGTYQVDLLPKIQLNIVLSDHNLEKTVDTICHAALTGREGDGLIFVYPVEEVIRIRTGERGRKALMYKDDIDARREGEPDGAGKEDHEPAVAEEGGADGNGNVVTDVST